VVLAKALSGGLVPVVGHIRLVAAH